MIYLQLFYTFFKIGLFGFGGGYAMLSMIQGEVVTGHEWITAAEFTDIVAISQMTPGPIGINSATYVGYTALANQTNSNIQGFLGALTATTAVILPSFILMLCVSRLLLRNKNNPVITNLFSGIRPAIVGLLAAAALVLMNSENFGSWQTDEKQFISSILLFTATFVGIRYLKQSPILLIFLAGLAGAIIYA